MAQKQAAGSREAAPGPGGARRRNFLQNLGPGLISGAADDDPSGIGTYSQVGAQFGYSMLWTMLFSYPLMAAVQEISALIGRVTGKGIAANLRQHYPGWVVAAAAILLFTANTINIGVDIGAMGAGAALALKGSQVYYALFFGLLLICTEVFIPYAAFVKWLKWLTLVLFTYVAVAFAVRVDWGAAFTATLIPRVPGGGGFLTALIAVLGTTISPYLFFWQASQEMEEVRADASKQPLRQAPRQAPAENRRIKADTLTGMAVSNLVAWFIIISAAATLHAQGITRIATAEQAAQALKPVAGELAFLLFALGLVGTGLLAVPVLAGSAAFAVGEALHWPVGLERKPLQAKGFYLVLALATLLGMGIVMLKVNPIAALFWSAVINGVAAAPMLLILMLMAGNRRIMGGSFRLRPRLRILGWLTVAVMFAASAGMFATWGR